MSYDTKCHDLAMHFLDDFVTKNTHTGADGERFLSDLLAQSIQDCIQDFIEDNKLVEKVDD